MEDEVYTGIVRYPSEILRQGSEPVKEFDHELHILLERMRIRMLAEKGIGISAIQVGVPLRAFIAKDGDGFREFVNPTITDSSGARMESEGCLSFPGVLLQVPRAEQVTVKAFDRDGNPFSVVAEGLEAVCVQHEYDHLNGVLFIDKVSRQQRRFATRRM